ncbi:MAG: hypothetical protein NVS4B8_22810 [Herpetosiphon sp.]
MDLRYAAQTDVGKTRNHNEDSYGIEPDQQRPEGSLFVVCDGAGGLAAGGIASEAAVHAILETYYATPGPDRGAALIAAFTAGNRAVWDRGSGKMGTTGVAAAFVGDQVIVANVGDSRALLIRNKRVRQLTRDHSFVAEQVAAGALTEDQARASSYRHVITRALGSRPDVDVDIFIERPLAGDRLVLCSDGLHGVVEPGEIGQAVTLVPLATAVERLIALANLRGGPDNVTVVAIEVLVTDNIAPDAGQPVQPNDAPADDPPAQSLSRHSGQTTPLTPKAGQQISSIGRRSGAGVKGAGVPPPLPVHRAVTGRGSFFAWLIVVMAVLALIGTLAFYSFQRFPESITMPTPVIATLTPPGGATMAATSYPSTVQPTPSTP